MEPPPPKKKEKDKNTVKATPFTEGLKPLNMWLQKMSNMPREAKKSTLPPLFFIHPISPPRSLPP